MGNAEDRGASGPELDIYRDFVTIFRKNQVPPTPKNFIPTEARFFQDYQKGKVGKTAPAAPIISKPNSAF